MAASDVFATNTVYVLADGTVFGASGSDPIRITFDVNGRKGPNTLGRDLWTFYAYNDGSIDDMGLTPNVRKNNTSSQINNTVATNFTSCKAGNSSYGSGCFGHFLRNKFKFDY